MVNVVIVFMVGGIIGCMYGYVRNNKVYKERKLQNEVIFQKDNNGSYLRSYDEIKELLEYRDSLATYQQAMRRFWKSVDKIYEDFYARVKSKNDVRNSK